MAEPVSGNANLVSASSSNVPGQFDTKNGETSPNLTELGPFKCSVAGTGVQLGPIKIQRIYSGMHKSLYGLCILISIIIASGTLFLFICPLRLEEKHAFGK